MKTYQQIQNCHLQPTPNDTLVQLHHEIFKIGVLIHFHRRILNSPPHTLIPHLDVLFHSVATYQQLGGGYITLWPVFIGAAEVYLEEHKRSVRRWMNEAEMMGARSRGDVRELVEAVWQKRREIAGDAGEGDVVVDWRTVMSGMGMDVLLV